MGGVLSRSQKMFSLLLLPSAALAWAPAPGIPLERQIPVNRQTTGAGSGSGSGCDFEPWTQECNATQIWCDSGYYNDYTCWYGNYCLDQVSSWDGCPGVCHMPCNWDTEEYCDMGLDDNGCWLGNYCMPIESGGCPSTTGSGSDYGSGASGAGTCFEPYTQECNSTEIHCDAGYDSEFCWYGNYCINQVNEWDGCHGVCSVNCNWETEDWCDMGTDLNGCWMGNWCQDKSMGGCPAPIGDPSLTLVRTSVPTCPTLRSAAIVRSLVTLATRTRVAGLETTALIPSTPGTTALACAAPCATGRPRIGATWAPTPMAAGWATGART